MKNLWNFLSNGIVCYGVELEVLNDGSVKVYQLINRREWNSVNNQLPRYNGVVIYDIDLKEIVVEKCFLEKRKFCVSMEAMRRQFIDYQSGMIDVIVVDKSLKGGILKNLTSVQARHLFVNFQEDYGNDENEPTQQAKQNLLFYMEKMNMVNIVQQALQRKVVSRDILYYVF